MLDEDGVLEVTQDLWARHVEEAPHFDRLYDFVRGQRGIPDIPEGANDELKHLARLSVKNVLGLIRDSFAQNLSVSGYHNASAEENAPAWRLWQTNRMDARQAEAYRAALTYGVSYCSVTPTEAGGPQFRVRSPRQMFAVYEDPQVDEWPLYALETWVDTSETKYRRRGLLYDSEATYPVDLGELPRRPTVSGEDRLTDAARRGVQASVLDGPRPHDAQVCPVARFINARDAEDLIVGEIEPLLTLQVAINSVNFDRLVVSRFGAFPQRYIIGWTSDAATVLKASMSRVWTFDDDKDDVSVGSLPAAAVEPYNALLEEMLEHVAMVAQISPAQVTGKMINLSAEALAAAEAQQQRKLWDKRDSFGETWEQVLRLGSLLDDDMDTAADESAEVQWRDTEARSFGAVVDGVTKLAAAGVPIDALLTQVPGLSQQQIQAIRGRISGTGDIMAALERLANGNGDGANVGGS